MDVPHRHPVVPRCPVCHAALRRTDSYACGNGHNFDIARSGYANLLLPNEKRSSHPGDDRAAARSRERFLDAGHFAAIRKTLAVCVNNPSSVLDVGCGTGYYLEGIADVCRTGALWGIDISKEALRIASGRSHHGAGYVVASAFRLPFDEESFDVMMSVFAPMDETESARILKPDGRLVVVRPGSHHLWELRKALYAQPRPSPQKTQELFASVEDVKIAGKISPSEAETMDLLRMTPYFWRVKDSVAKIKNAQLDRLTLDVHVTTLCRRS